MFNTSQLCIVIEQNTPNKNDSVQFIRNTM